MKIDNVSLTKPEMILLAMFELSGTDSKKLKFEDIVVKVHEMFPESFHLRGYPQFPDSGDLIHKPLYSSLKVKGLVQSGNKIFSLTPRGIDVASQRKDEISGKTRIKQDRFSRSSLSEIERMKKTEGFKLFLEGKENEIVETDLYSHIGASVRMSEIEFKGRMTCVSSAIHETEKNDEQDLTLPHLRKYNNFLMNKFKDTIRDFK